MSFVMRNSWSKVRFSIFSMFSGRFMIPADRLLRFMKNLFGELVSGMASRSSMFRFSGTWGEMGSRVVKLMSPFGGNDFLSMRVSPTKRSAKNPVRSIDSEAN